MRFPPPRGGDAAMPDVAAKPALVSGRFSYMLLRRLLGIFALSFFVVIPLAAQPEKDKAKEKAIDDAKAALKKAEAALTTAEKALADGKDADKKKPLQKAADKANKTLTTST